MIRTSLPHLNRTRTSMAFRSGLEEKVADLMVELGVKYEYEDPPRYPISYGTTTHLTSFYLMVSI